MSVVVNLSTDWASMHKRERGGRRKSREGQREVRVRKIHSNKESDAKIQREVGTDGESERQKEAETQIDEAGDTDRNAKKEKRRERETETWGLRCRNSETEQCRAPGEACPGEDN